MRSGRLVWWRREALGLARRVGAPGRSVRRRHVVLAGVLSLSVSLVAWGDRGGWRGVAFGGTPATTVSAIATSHHSFTVS